MSKPTTLSHAPKITKAIDIGYGNTHMEDYSDWVKIGKGEWGEYPQESIYIAIVADGVTSNTGGDKASEIAVNTIKQFCKAQISLPISSQALLVIMQQAIVQAHHQILSQAQQNPAHRDM